MRNPAPLVFEQQYISEPFKKVRSNDYNRICNLCINCLSGCNFYVSFIAHLAKLLQNAIQYPLNLLKISNIMIDNLQCPSYYWTADDVLIRFLHGEDRV
jgi:hypothetical protein